MHSASIYQFRGCRFLKLHSTNSIKRFSPRAHSTAVRLLIEFDTPLYKCFSFIIIIFLWLYYCLRSRHSRSAHF